MVFEVCHRFKKIKDTQRWEISQGIEIRGRVFGFWPFGLSLSEYQTRPVPEVKGALIIIIVNMLTGGLSIDLLLHVRI